MSKLLCCFCNNIIISDEKNPCDINISTNWDKSKTRQKNQFFWCHINCFRNVLHSDIRENLIVDLLSNESD